MFHLIVLLALACLYLLLCLQAALEPTRASFMSCLLTLIVGLTFTFGGFYCRWNRNCRLAMSHIEDWSHWSLADIHLHAHTSCYQDIGSVVPLVVKNWIADFRITPPLTCTGKLTSTVFAEGPNRSLCFRSVFLCDLRVTRSDAHCLSATYLLEIYVLWLCCAENPKIMPQMKLFFVSSESVWWHFVGRICLQPEAGIFPLIEVVNMPDCSFFLGLSKTKSDILVYRLKGRLSSVLSIYVCIRL